MAIVTGAALGIGKATAIMFAREGAKVAVTDILDEEGQEVVEEIKSLGRESYYWHLDVSKEHRCTPSSWTNGRTR